MCVTQMFLSTVLLSSHVYVCIYGKSLKFGSRVEMWERLPKLVNTSWPWEITSV